MKSLEEMLEKANKDAGGENGLLLYRAVLKSDHEETKRLIETASSLDLKFEQKSTLLHRLFKLEWYDIGILCLQKNASARVKTLKFTYDSKHRTPLMFLFNKCAEDRTAVSPTLLVLVSELINQGKDLTKKSREGYSAIDYAMKWGQPKINELISAQKDVANHNLYNGRSLFIEMVIRNEVTAVEKLIQSGTDLNRTIEFSPVFNAVVDKNEKDMVHLLIKAKERGIQLPLNMLYANGENPFTKILFHYKDTRAAQALLKTGEDVSNATLEGAPVLVKLSEETQKWANLERLMEEKSLEQAQKRQKMDLEELEKEKEKEEEAALFALDVLGDMQDLGDDLFKDIFPASRKPK